MVGEETVEGLRIVLHWNYFLNFDTMVLFSNFDDEKILELFSLPNKMEENQIHGFQTSLIFKTWGYFPFPLNIQISNFSGYLFQTRKICLCEFQSMFHITPSSYS